MKIDKLKLVNRILEFISLVNNILTILRMFL